MDLEKIISQCKKKDSIAEKQLFLRFTNMLFGICRRYAIDTNQAKDYLQESWMQIFENINKYDSAKGDIANWLCRICVNNVLMLKRKEISFIEFDEVIKEELYTTELIVEDVFSTAMVNAAIDQLADGFKLIFNLSVFEGWSHKEIADYLKISESTSRSQLARAKKQLRNTLLKSNECNYERRAV